MSKLEKKIKEAYGDSDELISLIKRVDLQNTLNITLEQIEAAINANDFQKLASLSGAILTGVNSKLSKVNDPNEKKKIEYLLADIFDEYIVLIASQSNGKDILKQVDDNLNSTCQLVGYDYNSLSAIFNIKKHLVLLPISKNSRCLYYDWNGILHELDELIKDIADKKWIFSIKEFKRLFSPVKGNLQIKCNSGKKNELLVLIHSLKDMRLISPKGKGNSGHFAPFIIYAVDNDGNFLFPKSVNKKHELLKRKPARYSELKGKVEKIINENAEKSLRQLRDNGHCPPIKRK